jgi:antitoxin ParD1/3/4
MNIQLRAEYEQFIQARIATGRYENAEDVIAKALKLLEEWEKGYQEWEEEQEKKISAGLASIKRGEVLDAKLVMAQMLDKLSKVHQE